MPSRTRSPRRQKSVAGNDGQSQQQNLLLAKLPPAEFAAFEQDAEEIECSIREVLFEDGDQISHVYFPTSSMISLLTVLADGTSIEAMTIGYEGMAGLPLFHGVTATRARGVCQIEGKMYRVAAGAFLRLVQSAPELSKKLHLFSQFANDAMAQSAACNSIHLIEQRCARWLLLTSDAVGDGSFTLTQEFLSQMLAVRRSGVTAAMGGLERQNLIAARYGAVTILDKEGLSKISCECYKAISDRRRDLLS
ncbi:MAG TPA: Crp/Fnr family transcriptional regulator [Gemmatimonadaceae bacterium]|jgi:CRP-like cAMP-binding protein|nr:Crp/Fnr family transcriptional regulator [Gemmatimonadaceae bacterium]